MGVNATSSSPVWRALQAVSVAAAVAVIAILLIHPRIGLFIAWNLLIPLVPFMLLVAPMLWRNLCPIGVVGQFFERIGVGWRRKLPRRLQRLAPAISITLLFVLVPLRLVLFNHDADALVALMVATILIAFVGGALVAGKAAWCSTFCPVLPVERLYGQNPLMNLPHAHCQQCVGCVGACFDLIPSRSLSVLSGAHNRSQYSPMRVMAIFAIVFPGFVLGYYTVPAEASLATIYPWILMMSAASAILFIALQRLLALHSNTMLRLGGAFAISIYYWFTIPAIATAISETFGTEPGAAWFLNALRIAIVAVVAAWLAIALRKKRPAAIAV